MRFPLVFALIIIIVNAAVDLYIYCALVSACRKRFWPRLQAWSAIAFFVALLVAICLPKRSGPNLELRTVMWIVFTLVSVYLPKYIFIIFDVLSRLPMLWRRKRCRAVSYIGGGIGIIIFAAMWWGALFNRYMIDVEEVDIEIAALPQSFDGLKIAQISDIHLGTYGRDTSYVSRLVDKINSLHPDIIVFTGDLVNRQSSEAKPFANVLSRLHAPMGVYSIMGNHDYGDYISWKNPSQKEADVLALKALQSDMGWHMLNNEHAWLHAGTDSIALIGVENVGEPPFHTYGDLSAAYPNIDDNAVKVLLSHNPSHWVNDIAGNPHSNIALTLSGHTHAMQIKVLGLSPSALRYRTWGGLYSDAQGQKLYVNIGIGEVGFPARIGATPEITLFTLKHK